MSTSSPKTHGFEAEAEATLVALRNSLASVIEMLNGRNDYPTMRKGSDLQRALGISGTLAWQIHRVSQASDPLSAASAIPRRRAMQRFLGAASNHGVPLRMIENVLAAVDEFERLVKKYAGTRREFESMLSGVLGNGLHHADLLHRRHAFMGNSHIWGVQARTKLNCALLHPGSELEMHDIAMLSGQVEMKRFRRDAPLVLARLRFDHEDGVECEPTIREPIEPVADAAHGMALLRDFCTSPLPDIKAVATESGFVSAEIVGDQLGKQSEVTSILGNVTRNIGSVYAQKNDRHYWGRTMVRTPTEVLVHDVLVYDSMFGPIAPRAIVYSDLRVGDTAMPYSESEVLQVGESVVHLGRGPAVVHSPDLPRYSEMMQYVCDRLGWDASRFDVYRCRIEYPVMPSSVVVEFELPERTAT